MNIAFFIFDTNAGPAPTVVPIMIAVPLSPIPIAMHTVAMIAFISATLIPVPQRMITVTIALAIPHAFVVALPLLLRINLRSLGHG